MLPSEKEMLFCIMRNGEILDGAKGLAIGETEQLAWERGLDPCQEWSIKKSKQQGYYVRRCALMVINA